MCGVDVDLAEEGEDERELEDEFAVGEAVRMLSPPMAHCDGAVWGPRRGRWGCLLWGSMLLLWNVMLALAGLLLLATIFTLVLTPATLLLYIGFLCHSRVLASPVPLCHYLDDNSCSALIILGFVMMSPLVVVAAATFCGLLRRFRLLLLFQPITGAWYRGRGLGWRRDVHAWV